MGGRAAGLKPAGTTAANGVTRPPVLRTSDFEFSLPPQAVAQQARPRGTSRLLVLERHSGRIHHTGVAALPNWLAPGDLMLLNDVRVIPARLRAVRPGGGIAEVLLVRPIAEGEWEAMVRPGRRLRPGMVLALRVGTVIAREPLPEGRWRVAFHPPLSEDSLGRVGEVPLPPYIRRDGGATPDDARRYQTVYAGGGRAVAAPTAGLHFTPELLAAVAARGVELVRLTLHVGPGTFRPVQTEDPRDHRLDAEDYEIPVTTALALNRALAAGRRVVCVGTTSCRALEHALERGGGRVRPGWGTADTFLIPGSPVRGTGALMTNFHLPRSTLLMLVSALASLESVRQAYDRAVAAGYRFYSFGDAMLVV